MDRILSIVAALAIAGCSASAPPTPPAEPTPQLVRIEPSECRTLFQDDTSVESLREAAVRSSAFFAEASQITVPVMGKSASRASLAAIAATAAEATSVATFGSTMCDRVAVYRVQLPGPLSISAYTDAPIPARRQRSAEFAYGVYEPPSDLVEVDLSLFCPNCERRLAPGRVSGSRLIPYYSRNEIDAGAIAGQDYELGWLSDPVEALLLELRGSGTLEFEDGTRMNLVYASNNGRNAPDPIAALRASGKLAPAAANLSGLRQYLMGHPQEAEELLRTRERVNFYGVKAVGPVGTLGTPITPGRSLAADPRFYARGMLGFVRIPTGPAPVSRFVFVQDELPGVGGADRVALFVGDSSEATLARLQASGELYLILPY